MARFQYRAVDADGLERSGAIEAGDVAQARAALQKRKLLPIELASAASGRSKATSQPAQLISGGALSHKARLVIVRQLATLIDAAVPVDEALHMVAAQQEKARYRKIVEDVETGVVEGMRLAESMGRHPDSFPGLLRAAVAGGERSGQLGFVLSRLADYLARAQTLRSKIQTAMVYPAALTAVAITVISCLMIFVVPTLTEQFQSFEAQLPLVTRVLIATSWFLSNFWIPLFLGLGVGGYFLSRTLRQEPVRAAVDAALLGAPLIGRWVEVVSTSRFVRAVSTLSQSGLPVLDCVRAARDSAPNRKFQKAVDHMADRIEEGEPFSTAMRRSGVVPVMVVYMAASGENAGELPKMLEKAADHLDEEFEAFTQTALSLFEPAIIVTMGAVVASIVLAIMLPILQLNQLAVG